MLSNRKMTCIMCPNGCELSVKWDGERIQAEGYLCEKGHTFAENEICNPQRILTTTVKVVGGKKSLISVRSDRPVYKSELPEIVRELSHYTVNGPVAVGQVIKKDVGRNGVNIVATSGVDGVT